MQCIARVRNGNAGGQKSVPWCSFSMPEPNRVSVFSDFKCFSRNLGFLHLNARISHTKLWQELLWKSLLKSLSIGIASERRRSWFGSGCWKRVRGGFRTGMRGAGVSSQHGSWLITRVRSRRSCVVPSARGSAVKPRALCAGDWICLLRSPAKVVTLAIRAPVPTFPVPLWGFTLWLNLGVLGLPDCGWICPTMNMDCLILQHRFNKCS